MKNEILRLEHAYLKKNNIHVLDDFNINIYSGEILVLFGLYGSGCQELGEVLSGKRKLTQGKLYYNEQQIVLQNQYLAEKLGIYSVYNEDNLVPELSIAENIFLSWNGNIFRHALSKKKLKKQADRILQKFNINLNGETKAARLSKVEQHIVKLLRAYVKKANLVIFHDIADVYTAHEYQMLFHTIQVLLKEDTAFLWISGRIGKISELADRLVVMKKGKRIRTFLPAQINMDDIMKLYQESIFTREMESFNNSSSRILFHMDRLSENGLNQVSFQVFEGEVVGIWGLESKQLERLKDILLGENQKYSGKMFLGEEEYHPKDLSEAVKRGVSYVDMINPENNLVLQMSIKENIILKNMQRTSKFGIFVNSAIEDYVGMRYEKKWETKPQKKVEDLDYGQRLGVIFERFIEDNTKLIIGTEVLSMLDYLRAHQLMDNFRDVTARGKSILIFSVNYDDLRQACNRIYALVDGKIVACIPKNRFALVNMNEYVTGHGK